MMSFQIELTGEVAPANAKLSGLEKKGDELEDSLANVGVCLAPRVIPDVINNGKSYAEPLSPLAGYTVHIVVVPDPEARRAAGDLARTLHDAGMIVKAEVVQDPLLDGVWVNWYSFASASNEDSAHAGSPTSIANHEAVPKSESAADSIISFLGSYNWQARKVEASVFMTDVTPHGLRIEVGLYPPNEVVTPPAMVGVHESMMAAIARDNVQRQIGRSKRLEERIKDLPPKDKIAARIADAKRVQDEADLEKKYDQEAQGSSPCRSLKYPH